MSPVSDAARHRALLDARSAALAQRGLGKRRRDAATVGFLVCALCAERFGLPVEAVATVLPDRPCTPLPGAGGALRGIIAHAGEIVTVIDPAHLLGLTSGAAPDAAAPREPRHLVRLRAKPPMALLFDRVLGLASLSSDRLTARREGAPGVGSDGPDGGGLGASAISGYAIADPDGGASEGFAVLDPERLLAPLMS